MVDRRKLRQRAALVGALVSVALVVAILLGSRGLRDFDSALLPYAVATVFLAFGVSESRLHAACRELNAKDSGIRLGRVACPNAARS